MLTTSNVFQLDWSLKAVGTEGSLEVSRGGWKGSKAGYTLTTKRAEEAEPQVKFFSFSGVSTEFSSFLDLVSLHLPVNLRGILFLSCAQRCLGQF
jgi:hypothetical protein